MNYEKIYNNFISDRRQKEENYLNNYTESHHIIPKCMGGSDDKDNLINLIPEDHFFAHLLLAKAFGGKNWLALHSMLHRGMKTEEISYKDFANKRKQFGFIRRLVSKNFSGENNTQADKSIYTFKNKDGREVTGTRLHISKQTGLKPRAIGKLINGRLKTCKNWYYPVLNPTGLTLGEANKIQKISSAEEMTLYHFDGREWTGTSYEFYLEFGSYLLLPTEKSFCLGWFKSKELAVSYFEKKTETAKREARLYEFVDTSSNETFLLSKYALSKRLNVSKGKVNDLILGKVSRIKGIKLSKRFTKNDRPLNGTFYKFKFIDTGVVIKSSVKNLSEKFGIPTNVIYSLIQKKIKVSKKYRIALV